MQPDKITVTALAKRPRTLAALPLEKVLELVRAPSLRQRIFGGGDESYRQARGVQTYGLALKPCDLFKDDEAVGVVFFEKKKALSDDGLLLRIPLGGVTFEIPFGKARTGQ